MENHITENTQENTAAEDMLENAALNADGEGAAESELEKAQNAEETARKIEEIKKSLIEKGKKKGVLSFKEVISAFSETEINPED
ncbi:MAG TPA: hypothetical protein IAA60_02110, partial [Candidatus Ornithomonoglobus intestinigallinarum]|nr:hypothetical protein [Candidatus Ornithomonoglobus intestinigallinarum]